MGWRWWTIRVRRLKTLILETAVVITSYADRVIRGVRGILYYIEIVMFWLLFLGALGKGNKRLDRARIAEEFLGRFRDECIIMEFGDLLRH